MLKDLFHLKPECFKLDIDGSAKDRFIDLNSGLWNARKKQKENISVKNCYIVSWSSANYLASIIPQLLFAQGMATKENIEIMVLSRQVDNNWIEFNASFGAMQKIAKRRLIDKIYGLCYASLLILKRTSGEKILKTNHRGIPIGECVYDHIVRTTPNQYTLDKISYNNYAKLYEIFSYFSCIYHVFKVNPPDYYMPYERCHIEGMFTIMAAYFGAEVIHCMTSGRIHYLGNRQEIRIREHDILKRTITAYMEKQLPGDYTKVVREYFNERFAGKGNFDVINAFKDKTVISREDFVSQNHLDRTKKNVVIMPHVFSDESHGSEFTIFRDYYTWYKETLKMAADIQTVNWIIKPHPSRKIYGEDQESYDLFMKYKSDNMVWLPDEYSTESLIDLADAIVTVQGTSGKEFSCFGKPIVLAGRAYYSGFGFTIEPQTVEEYRSVLDSLYKITPSDEETIDKAYKVMYICLMTEGKFLDKFDEFLRSSQGMDCYQGNNLVLSELNNQLSKDGNYYYNTEFYRIGTIAAEQIKELQAGNEMS